jgi:magnesium chelatase subunit I
VPRICDLESIFPAIAGKLEMEYDVEDRTETELLEDLSKRAVKTVFNNYFELDQLAAVTQVFETGMQVTVSRSQPSAEYQGLLEAIPGLKEIVATLVDATDPAATASAIEFILEGLHLSNRINRDVVNEEVVYR